MVGRTVAEVSAETERAAAFRSLVEDHLDRSYRLAVVILGDATEAEDAVQDAFEAAWRKWSSLRDQNLFEHWFGRILVNTCRDHVRRRSRSRVADISAELAVETPDPYGAAITRDVVDRGLAELSADDQTLLALRYYRDLKVDDIAAVLGMRPGTVMARLHHAMRRLRAVMDTRDGGEARP